VRDREYDNMMATGAVCAASAITKRIRALTLDAPPDEGEGEK